MRIQFDATLDEIAELHERLTARSKIAGRWRRQAQTLTAFLSGSFVGVIIVAGGLMAGTPLLIILSVAFVGFVFGIVMGWSTYRDNFRKRLRTYFREQYGDRTAIPFELEINEAGLITKQLGVQASCEWSSVEEIVQRPDSIEFYMLGGGAIFMRKRAFLSADDEEKFQKATEKYLNVSCTSSNWLRDG